jgi:glutathione S-transferase
MQLYYCANTRAFTALWMLEEVGEPYELVHTDVRAPGHPAREYLGVNPMGKVPGLRDGDCAFGETAAILLYLADKFPRANLAPAPHDPRRGRFLQWLMFTPSTLEPVWFEKQRGTPSSSFSAGWGDYARATNALEAALAPGPCLFGDPFTAADLYLASSLGFGMRFGLQDKRPVFEAFVARAEQRPAFQRALRLGA